MLLGRKSLFITGLFIVALLLPVTVFLLQRQQDTRSKADGGAVCKDVPADVSLVIDRSGSMNDRISTSFSGPTKLSGAKTAANNFATLLSQNTQNRANLVTYESTSRLNVGFTSNFSSITSAINAISANGGTCIECGIKQANADIKTNGRAGLKKVVVLLTDGRANFILGSSREQTPALAEQKALEAAMAGRTESGIVYFTIGLGRDVNTNFLQQIATQTGGKYYFSPTPEALNQIYATISEVIAQGSVGGMLFSDINANAVFEQGEQKLPNWTVQAVSSTGSTQTSVSDVNGNYFISGLCDGTYTVKPVVQSGWTQTLPVGGASHTVLITNGSAVVGKDFGFNMPLPSSTPTPVASVTPIISPTLTLSPTVTPMPTTIPLPTSTPVPGALNLALEVFLHNIGNSGDNANPAFGMSNKSPLHLSRDAVVTLYDVNGQAVATTSGDIKYLSATGSFMGIFVVDPSVKSGAYLVKARTGGHLTKLLPGMQLITEGHIHKLPTAHYVAGDNNNDNRLSILDYNMILDCYSDLLAAPACNAQKKLDTDPNDDGKVNQFDYNLFIREISVQYGD